MRIATAAPGPPLMNMYGANFNPGPILHSVSNRRNDVRRGTLISEWKLSHCLKSHLARARPARSDNDGSGIYGAGRGGWRWLTPPARHIGLTGCISIPLMNCGVIAHNRDDLTKIYLVWWRWIALVLGDGGRGVKASGGQVLVGR